MSRPAPDMTTKGMEMMKLLKMGRRWAVGVAFALAGVSAFAATYNISLFEGATGTGSGQFAFTNPGSVGGTSTVLTSLSTNASSTAGVRTFAPPGSLTVQVAAVDFVDGKNPPNTIKGNFVEGLTGSLDSAAAEGLSNALGCNNQLCFYRITFAFTSNLNPASMVKSYTLTLVRQSNGNTQQVAAGTYAVANTTTIPEPGSLALMALALVALAWRLRRPARLTLR